MDRRRLAGFVAHGQPRPSNTAGRRPTRDGRLGALLVCQRPLSTKQPGRSRGALQRRAGITSFGPCRVFSVQRIRSGIDLPGAASSRHGAPGRGVGRARPDGHAQHRLDAARHSLPGRIGPFAGGRCCGWALGGRRWPGVPPNARERLYPPQLTLAKVLLAENTPAGRSQAAQVLEELYDFLSTIHNQRFLIETLALQGLLHDQVGDERAPLAAVQRAIDLAQPGGFIRLFVDLGPGMAGLLVRLSGARQTGSGVKLRWPDSPGFCGCRAPAPSALRAGLTAPLTHRELEILALLAQRRSNKEIAQELVISPQTVKRHTLNIYQKLQVNGRRPAVHKAASMGLTRDDFHRTQSGARSVQGLSPWPLDLGNDSSERIYRCRFGATGPDSNQAVPTPAARGVAAARAAAGPAQHRTSAPADPGRGARRVWQNHPS